MPKPFVRVKLDKERNIRFTIKALMELEEHYSKPYHQFDPANWGLNDIVYLLWLGLKHEDPGLTLDDVVRLVDEVESLDYVFEKVAEAYGAAFVGKKAMRSAASS